MSTFESSEVGGQIIATGGHGGGLQDAVCVEGVSSYREGGEARPGSLVEAGSEPELLEFKLSPGAGAVLHAGHHSLPPHPGFLYPGLEQAGGEPGWRLPLPPHQHQHPARWPGQGGHLSRQPQHTGYAMGSWQGDRGESMLRYGANRDECGSGLSRESSRDDINSECEQQFEYEQRFRVDRRKLEMMMLNSPEYGEAAAEFFERISRETNTVVIWPSRLKIGAKSKKDPHIRVGGSEEGVKRAKLMVTEVLDTTTNSRVTMKMDVSYTDHSHIIGKGGNTIRRVMAETNCHIHFPDSNRSNPNEKSNQVSIAGEMAGVERARARVRELTPLLFNFDLPIVPSFQSAPDTNSPYLRAIQDQYNIQIMFRQKQKNFHTTTVVVKGCEWECARVKEATLLLVDHLCTGMAGSVPVIMTMEISPQHHATVLGKGNINLKIIMQRTNTTIIFPDAGDPNIPPIKKGSVSISGSIHNVYLARQLLLGSLPVIMMFDIPEALPVDEGLISSLQEQQEITISIKPKARQSNKSCIIKTQERNTAGLYVARHTLLHLDKTEEPIVRAEIPETYKVPLVGSSSNYHIASMPATRGPFLHVNTQLANYGGASSPLMSPSYLAGGPPATPLYTPSLAHGPPLSPWGGLPMPLPPMQGYSGLQQATSLASQPPPPPPSTPVQGLSQLTPNHPYLQDYAMLVLNNITRLQEAEAKHSQQQEPGERQERERGEAREGVVQPSPSPSTHGMGVSGHGSSGMGSSLHSSPLRSSPRPPPRNSSPVDVGGNLTNNLHKMDLTAGSSGIMGDKGNSSVTCGSQDLSNLLGELSMGDRRAPGCERSLGSTPNQVQAGDYCEKRLLATKAMQHKVCGEPRTPNPVWAGLGFSNSMPEAVIREKLAQEHNRSKQAREKEVASNSDFWQSQAYELLPNVKKVASSFGEELPVLLAKQGLSKYTDVFLHHEIDLPTFVTLTDDELKEIGIHTFGARKKLLLLAKEARQKYAQ